MGCRRGKGCRYGETATADATKENADSDAGKKERKKKKKKKKNDVAEPAAETGDGKQKKKKKLTKTAAVPTAADPDTVPQTVPIVSGEPPPYTADEVAKWEEEMRAANIADAKQLEAMWRPSGPQRPKERLWDGTDDGEEPLRATREKVVGLSATPAACHRQSAARVDEEENKINSTKHWLADPPLSQVNAEFGLKAATRLARGDQLAEAWPDCTPSQRPLMDFTTAFMLTEYSPDVDVSAVVVKEGVFDPPILFLEFAELLKTYLESKEVAEPIPVCLDKSCEFEEKKTRITSVLIEKASTCMGPGETLDDHLLPVDFTNAVDYYYAMVQARDILTTSMGRALVYSGRCGGSVWNHLFAMHGDGDLWSGAEHCKPVLPHPNDLERNPGISDEVRRWKDPARVYQAVGKLIQEAARHPDAVKEPRVTLFYWMVRPPYMDKNDFLCMGTMFRHAIGTVERRYAKQAQHMQVPSSGDPALDPNVTSEYEKVMGNFPHSQTDAILHSLVFALPKSQHPAYPSDLASLSALIHASLDIRSTFSIPFRFSPKVLGQMKFLGIKKDNFVNTMHYDADDQKLTGDELKYVQDMPDRESFRTRNLWYARNTTLVGFGHVSRFRKTAEGLVVTARAEAMAAIQKLDQTVRNLTHLEQHYDVQTDQAATALAFVELVATAEAAANHLSVGDPGVQLHADTSHRTGYVIPSFANPALALPFSSKWDEDARSLVKKLRTDGAPEGFQSFYEDFHRCLELTLNAAPTADLPPMLDIKANCRRTVDAEPNVGRYPCMLLKQCAVPSMALPHRRFNNVLLECTRDQVRRSLPPSLEKLAPCPPGTISVSRGSSASDSISKLGPLPEGAEWIASTITSRSKGATVLSVWKMMSGSDECREALEKHAELRHTLEDDRYQDDERETLLYNSFKTIRSAFEVQQEARAISLTALSLALYQDILAPVGTLVDPKAAYITLRNRVQTAVDAYGAEMAKPLSSTDRGLFRKALADLRREVNYVPDSLRSTSLFVNRDHWLGLVRFAERMHLDTFAMQNHPLVQPIEDLKKALLLTDENKPKLYSPVTGLPSSFSMGASSLMCDVLDDRLYGSDSFSETGLKRRDRLIAAGGVHSFAQDLERERHSKALHSVHTGIMASAPASAPISIDLCGALGSEDSSTDPGLVPEPAAPDAIGIGPAVPTVPVAAPPASAPPGPDLASNLTPEEQEAALAAVLAKSEREHALLVEAQADLDAAVAKAAKADQLVTESREAVRARNHERQSIVAVPAPAPLPEPVNATMTEAQFQESVEADRVDALARSQRIRADAAVAKVAADKAAADEAAAAKAKRDAAVIEEAERICARMPEDNLDRDPVVGEKRPSPGDASPPHQPRIPLRLIPKRKVNDSKK